MKNEELAISLTTLCSLVSLPRRTVRYYIQKGLVQRPNGAGKGAHYTQRHVEQLLTIRKWKKGGLSLDRIKELLGRDPDMGRTVPPERRRKSGQVEVWTKMFVADGIELHVEPGRAGLNPEDVSDLFQSVLAACGKGGKKSFPVTAD